MTNKNKWYFSEFTKFEKKFFDDLLDMKLKKSNFVQSNILNHVFNQNDCILNDNFNQDDFSINKLFRELDECTEYLKEEELKNSIKYRVRYSLSKSVSYLDVIATDHKSAVTQVKSLLGITKDTNFNVLHIEQFFRIKLK